MKTHYVVLVYLIILAGIFGCTNGSRQPVSQSRIAKLLENAENTSFPEPKRKQFLDSASGELSNAKNDSVTRFFYRKIAIDYYELDAYDKSLVTSKKIFKLSTDAKDSLSIAKSLLYSAEAYYGKENNDSAFVFYSQAEKMYEKLQDPTMLGEIILYKAYIFYNAGEYELCENEAIDALKRLQNQSRATDIYNCYNLIGSALDGQNKSEQAIKYYNQALKQLDQFAAEGYTPDHINLIRASCFNNMGGVYVKLDLHNRAIDLYNQALAYPAVKADSRDLYAKLVNNLAYAKFKSGDLDNLPALFYESLKIRDSMNNTAGVVASHIYLGEYFAYKKDTVTAISYLKKAYDDATAIKSNFDVLNSLKMLSEIDTKNRFFYSNKYITVNDHLQEIGKKNRDNFARIEYETDKLESEKEALLKKNSLIIGLSALALLFAGSVFVIYYLNSRNKKLMLVQEQQKANEEIYQLMFEQQSKIEGARKEEKDRIAMELHDGILNNIYAIRLNIEFINKKSDEESILKRKEFIKELQNVETEIRNVSHELSRNAIFQEDKSFKKLLEFMIISQKNQFETSFEADLDDTVDWDSLSNVFKVNIYRIVQESLQNINKYSKAKNAVVTITESDNTIVVNITDNGAGFDTNKAKGGIGIKNLKKRAALINGTLSIVSGIGKGTVVEVVLPV